MLGPRFSFPGDDILRNADTLKLSLFRCGGHLCLTFELHGSIGNPFEDDNHADGTLLEPTDDAAAMAYRLLEAMQKGGPTS